MYRLPKNSVIIYSHSCCSKPVCMTYFLLWNIEEDHLRNVSVVLLVSGNQNDSVTNIPQSIFFCVLQKKTTRRGVKLITFFWRTMPLTLWASSNRLHTANKAWRDITRNSSTLFFISHAVSLKLWREVVESAPRGIQTAGIAGKLECSQVWKWPEGKNCATLQHPHALLFNSH